MDKIDKQYRYGVVGVFINDEGKLLVCERTNEPGSWQFAQGGIDPGENPTDAIVREIEEELGTKAFQILKEGDRLTSYDFPSHASFAIAKEYIGQKHHWFLLEFVGQGAPDLSRADQEFRQVKWVDPIKCLENVVDWKRAAYHEGLAILGFKI